MKFRALPGTDLQLSVVGMGCWALGNKYWGPQDEATSIATVHAALEAGVNWFDTAPLYGDGHADTVLARALRGHDAVIATKVGIRNPGASGHAESDLSAAHLRSDLEASLRRLGREQIDLLQVHWPCQQGTPLEETFGTLDALRREGKVRHIGVCNYNARTLTRIAEITRLASLQTPYSLVRREFELDLRQAAQAANIGVLAYETLARGLLTGKYRHPPAFDGIDLRLNDDRFRGAAFHHIQRLTQDLGRVAQKLKIPTAAVAAGWIAAQPGVTAVIIGARSPEQARINAQATRIIGKPVVARVVDQIASIHGGPPPP